MSNKLQLGLVIVCFTLFFLYLLVNNRHYLFLDLSTLSWRPTNYCAARAGVTATIIKLLKVKYFSNETLPE